MVETVNGIKFDGIELYTCKKCGEISKPTYTNVKSNNSIQARCSGCNAFIKNMKQTCNAEEQELPTQKQILFIKSCYSKKQMPKTKQSAINLISVLIKVQEDYEL